MKLYAQQHYLPDQRLNLVENYDPNLGGPIVYYYWSNHYLHSSFNNLIITGLCGIMPRADDSLTIHPLVDSTISYFYLGPVIYHGHDVTLYYDQDGTHYGQGSGLTVFVDGKKVSRSQAIRLTVPIPKMVENTAEPEAVNIALNIDTSEYPRPSASIHDNVDSLFQAIDGRIWYFPEIKNYWSTRGSMDSSDWYGLTFEKAKKISKVSLYFFADSHEFAAPNEIILEYQQPNQTWQKIELVEPQKPKIIPNTVNHLLFPTISTTSLRCHLVHPENQVALVEIEVY